MANGGDEMAMSNKFPGKLWRIINACETGAIRWGEGGHTIILHQTLFTQQYLQTVNNVFKTTNIGSFIRQLNLYGFRKINATRYPNTEHGKDLREIHEFQNDYFTRSRPELLTQLRRNVGIRRSREIAVKRRFESISYTGKRPKIFGESLTNRVDEPHTPPQPDSTSQTCTTTACKQVTNYTLNNPTGLQATQAGDWPVYVQWDGNAYKYVILPEEAHKVKKQQAKQQQQQEQDKGEQQPVVIHKQQHADGSDMQVIHLPECQSSGCQEYYLVSLLPESGQGDKQHKNYSDTEVSDFYKLVDFIESGEVDSVHIPLSSQVQDSTPNTDGEYLQAIRTTEELPPSDYDSNPFGTPPPSVETSMSYDNNSNSGDTMDKEPQVQPPAALPDHQLGADGTPLKSSAVKVETIPEQAFYGFNYLFGDVDKSELDVYIRGDETSADDNGGRVFKERRSDMDTQVVPESCVSLEDPEMLEEEASPIVCPPPPVPYNGSSTSPDSPTCSPVSPGHTPVSPERSSVASAHTPDSPERSSVASAHTPLSPERSSVASAHTPVSPAHSSVASAHTPVSPARSSVAPAHTPVSPAHSSVASAHTPVSPERSSVASAHTPVSPAHSSVASAHTPVSPARSSVASAHTPVSPTRSSVASAHTPVSPECSSVISVHTPVSPARSSDSPARSLSSPSKPTSPTTPTVKLDVEVESDSVPSSCEGGETKINEYDASDYVVIKMV